LLFFVTVQPTIAATPKVKDKASVPKKPGEFYGTITEETPSIPQYFSWISHMNEGLDEAQTMAQLEFFKWLNDEYGMKLEIYAWDAGMIDTSKKYGSMETEEFKKQFPNGWGQIAKYADSFSCKLGLWGGPDGYGNTPEQEQVRRDLLVGLCRDYGMRLFKFDAVCGQLRDTKQGAFAQTMMECRKYVPDLVVLNHRLNVGDAIHHTTTFLWEGGETYIDTFKYNKITGTHNRVDAMNRGLPKNLSRLTEDHGVCISSCVDFWEDDLILQAFNRCLILAPEVYGNPWLLRDDEYGKLARIYNLHYRHRDILVKGIVLPKDKYGRNAVSRGDGATRYITLRNLTWNPKTFTVKLDEEIGLTDKGTVEVRRYHPSERILGEFDYGKTVEVQVQPFRSYLLMATVKPCLEIGVQGCDYEVVRDTKNKPVLVKLLGMPGSKASVSLESGDRSFSKAFIGNKRADNILKNNIDITFPGKPFQNKEHRKLAELKVVDVPSDAERLYESMCFAADNSMLEVQSLNRSGATNIPQVQKARDALFENEYFWRRGLWDKYMFDGKMETFFGVYRYTGSRESDRRISGGALRLDMGRNETVEKMVISGLWPVKRKGEPVAELTAEVSTDLRSWKKVTFKRGSKTGEQIDVAYFMQNGSFKLFDTDVYNWTFVGKDALNFRYLRIVGSLDRVAEFTAWNGKRQIDSSAWHATHLFAPYKKAKAAHAWQANVQIDSDAPEGSYLCVAFEGKHGINKACAALRVGNEVIGAPLRAPSFPSIIRGTGPKEYGSNNTYYIPVTDDMRGKNVDVVGLLLKGGSRKVKPHVWITSYPTPYKSAELRLEQ